MAYTNAWNEAAPLGSAQANTIDDIIRQFKLDIRERVAGIFGISGLGFTLDPVVPISLSLTGSLSADSLAGTIVTAAQTNITSLGVLSTLTVSGTITGSASIVAVGGFLGSLTGNVTGNVSGTASFATQLATPRAINGVNFDGTAAITVTAAAGTLTGAVLAAGVLGSSLTSVGTLNSLTVTNPITGSVTGAAGSVAAANLTGTTLAAGVTGSSITSVGATLTATAATFNGAVVLNGATSVANGQTLTIGSNSLLAGYWLMGTPTQTGAQANTIIFINDRGVVGTNAANNAPASLIKMNTSDQIELGATGNEIKWARTFVALGGGAAPTLGTIGGSGPATAAQASWLPVRDSAGNARFIPLWG